MFCLFVASLSPNFNFKLALLSRARPLALDRQGRPNWSRLRTNHKMECSHRDPESPNEIESSTVLDSGFRAVDSRFQVPDSSICQ